MLMANDNPEAVTQNPWRLILIVALPFWIYAAERHLANYLWEQDNYPPGDKLRVEDLDPEDCILALRWETT